MKLFIVRDPSQALKLGFRPGNNLLVFKQFNGTPGIRGNNYQQVGRTGVQPFVKSIDRWFSFRAMDRGQEREPGDKSSNGSCNSGTWG